MRQIGLLEFFHQLLFEGFYRPTAFVNTVSNRAGAQLYSEPVTQKFLNLPSGKMQP
jgi:hypothetical protein